MHDESWKLIIRRSSGRILETGLLILAVALGIGAASSGMALLANTVKSSRQMLALPAYREIVVSTASEASEMEEPVTLKPVTENAILTSSDLDAADMAPSVVHSYVKNHSRMNFINEESIAREEKRRQEMEQMGPPEGFGGSEAGGDTPVAPGEGAPPEGGPGGFGPPDQVNLDDYSGKDDIVIAELEDVSGYEVTPDFFDAWGLSVAAGSLFSQSELTGTASVAVLGSELAVLIAGEDMDITDLPGKKLLTRDGLVTVIGVLEEGAEENNSAFFSPYQSDGGHRFFRMMFMNTQLRFTVDDPDRLDETAGLLQQWFDTRYGEQQIVISNPRSEALQLTMRNTGIGMLILFLSLAGLFIASVNVSNILMSRALRMKKQVGILMALGGSRKKIMQLFAGEAMGITLAGAVLGTFFSFPLGRYMQNALEITGGSWLYTLLGVLLSAGLTLLFSLVPARQYGRIQPADAMRAA